MKLGRQRDKQGKKERQLVYGEQTGRQSASVGGKRQETSYSTGMKTPSPDCFKYNSNSMKQIPCYLS